MENEIEYSEKDEKPDFISDYSFGCIFLPEYNRENQEKKDNRISTTQENIISIIGHMLKHEK